MPRFDRRLTPTEKVDARAALLLLDGTGLSLEECARRAIVGHRAGKRITFTEAHDYFIRSRLQSGARQATVYWYQSKLQPFLAAWGARQIDTISRADIRAAVTALAVSDSTKAGHSRALSALWHWCAAEEPPYVGADVTHGLRVTPPRQQGADRQGFLSIEAVAQILASHPDYRNAYALQFFAGVRPEEVAGQDKPRLLHRHVLRAERYIRIPEEIAKTGKARLIQKLPDAFWAWYRPAADLETPISPVLSSTLRKNAQRVTAQPLPFDAFRHTFITYAVALKNDAGPVSLWVGHEGKTTLIFTNYLGLVTHATAKSFWALRPVPLPLTNSV